MQVLYDIWNVIFNQVITKPQLLLAIIVALGYALLKRPLTTIIAGAIKTGHFTESAVQESISSAIP